MFRLTCVFQIAKWSLLSLLAVLLGPGAYFAYPWIDPNIQIA